jgi:hypothetical protein
MYLFSAYGYDMKGKILDTYDFGNTGKLPGEVTFNRSVIYGLLGHAGRSGRELLLNLTSCHLLQRWYLHGKEIRALGSAAATPEKSDLD